MKDLIDRGNIFACGKFPRLWKKSLVPKIFPDQVL